MEFIYETHLHTSTSSKCGKLTGEDYVKIYKEVGYTGFIVTDHFYHGNTAVDRQLPWEDFVEQFCKGYEIAKKAGDEMGVDVFFGWEENFLGDEYLIYGLDKEWMKKHPEMLNWTQKEQYEAVHAAGGLVVQAHPFRDRDYLNAVHVHPHFVDAWEVNNFGNSAAMDARAYLYAKKHGIRMTSGSDVHYESSARARSGGMILNKRITDVKEYVQAVLDGSAKPMLFENRMGRDISNYEEITRPMFIYDEENVGKEFSFDFKDYL